MDEQAAGLRSAIERCRANAATGRWRASQEVRAAVVAYTRQCLGDGVSVERVAVELGVGASALRRWLEAELPSLRRVVVEAGDGDGAEGGGQPGPTLVSPRGYRVEGLSLEAVRALLVALE